MTQQNMDVLTNVIGAVESGGQVYGRRDYAAYAAPYTNSEKEHTITLGWAQNYGAEVCGKWTRTEALLKCLVMIGKKNAGTQPMNKGQHC